MSERGPILALDIGGTKIAGGLVSPEGKVSLARQVPSEAQQGGEAVMQRAIALAQALRDEATASGRAPAAIGVGSAGDIQPETGVVTFATASIPNWTGMPIRRRMEAALALPAFVDNDGNVMALGEAALGAGQGCLDMIGLTVGTGIGGGIIAGGHVYHGAGGSAGALGHIIIDYQEQRPCACGGAGCLEAYAASPALVADFVSRAGEARLAELELDPARIGVKEIAELAHQGDGVAQAVIQRGAYYLGIGIASLLRAFNPAKVVVAGGVAQIGEMYLAEVRRVAHQRAKGRAGQAPILAATLGTQANLVGAAELARQGLGHTDCISR
jgi:glucokinase